MYKHCDTDFSHLTPHDCIAEKIYLDGNCLVMEFPDGIYIGPNHPRNHTGKCLRSDTACLRFENVVPEEEGVFAQCPLHIMGKERMGRRSTRSLYELEDVLSFLQKKKARLEFLDLYLDYRLHMICGILWFPDGKRKDFFWQIEASSVSCLWNRLCPDREW